MTQEERRSYLINYLTEENKELAEVKIPNEESGQKRLLRSLMNIRPPKPISKEFLEIQDAYLQAERGKIVSLSELEPIDKGIYLWQGDITKLAADGIVNAANSALLGCFIPCHGCIDNAIHSAAGVQLRLECARIMEKQGCPEPTGKAKITSAYNLPCRYVLHTVGPIVQGRLTRKDCELLEACYISCLNTATEHSLKSLAFCCISTGEFHFPNKEAAEIAVKTVKKFRETNSKAPEVIFNVFKDIDREIYERLLK